MAEQVALNAAIYLHALPTHRLPSIYNWLACLALPSWDLSTELFVDHGTASRTRSGIMHLSLHVLQRPALITCLHPGTQPLGLKTSLSWGGRQELVRFRPQILAALQSAETVQQPG